MVQLNIVGYTTGDPQKVDVTGDIMTGNLTIEGSGGNSRVIAMESSFSGGENTTDSTSRLILESYQRAQLTATTGQPGHFGEVIRIYSRRWDSKQMIAWYGPTSYDPTTHLPVGNDTAWFWMGAHYEANDHGSVHGHWSVEVPDSNAELQTRFDMRIWNPDTGEFGMDVGEATFYQTHLDINNNGGVHFDYNTGDMVMGQGTNPTPTSVARLDVRNNGAKAAIYASTTADGTASTAVVRVETSSAAKRGIDMRVVGDNVSRARLDSSGTSGSGALTFGDGTVADVRLYRSAVDVLSTDDSYVVAVRQTVGSATLNSRKFYVEDSAGTTQTALFKVTAAGTASQAVVAAEVFDTTKRGFDYRVTADGTSRWRVGINANGSGELTFGNGTLADTNLYREQANMLKTDDVFVINSTTGASALSSLVGGYGNSVAFKGLVLQSSYPSDDIGGGTDGTGRLYTFHYQRGNAYSFGEWHRAMLMRSDAKAMDSMYLPILNGKVAFNDDRTPASGASFSPAYWTGAHFEANDHGSIHGHWELEIPDESGALQGRLEVPYVDQTLTDGLGNTVFGIAYTNIRTNLADFSVRAQLMTAGTYSGQVTALRIGGNNTVNKDIKMSISSDMSDTGRRWAIRVNTDSEVGGGNVGSNWQLIAYDNNGSQLGSSISVDRATRNTTFGAAGSLGARVGVSWATGHGISAQPSISPGSSSAYDATMTATTDRAYQSRVSGDTSSRHVIYTDGKLEWGDGTSRDTNLYRIGANRLATDDSFTITAGELSIGAGLSGNSVFSYTNASATNNGLNLTNTASAGNSGSPHVRMESINVGSLAFTSRITGDTSSRFLQTVAGSMQWGPGGSASRDVTLYRNAVGQLKTDTGFTAANVSIGAALDTSLLYVSGDGTTSNVKLVTSAETSPSTAVLRIEIPTPATASVSKRGFDYRVASDSVSRIRFDMNGGLDADGTTVSASGSGTLWFGDGALADVNLYRKGANIMRTDDKFVTLAGLGIGNSTVATSAVGALARKMQVFDAAGNSLGFVPIYTSIS